MYYMPPTRVCASSWSSATLSGLCPHGTSFLPTTLTHQLPQAPLGRLASTCPPPPLKSRSSALSLCVCVCVCGHFGPTPFSSSLSGKAHVRFWLLLELCKLVLQCRGPALAVIVLLGDRFQLNLHVTVLDKQFHQDLHQLVS